MHGLTDAALLAHVTLRQHAQAPREHHDACKSVWQGNPCILYMPLPEMWMVFGVGRLVPVTVKVPEKFPGACGVKVTSTVLA